LHLYSLEQCPEFNFGTSKNSLKCKFLRVFGPPTRAPYQFCCTNDNYNMQICRCKDPGRDSMFRTSVGELSTWLQYSLGKQTVSATVVQYLLSCREEQMSDCVHGTGSLLHFVASVSDRLGWDCMLEGGISIQWLQLVAPLLQRTGCRVLPQAWGILFITKLHNMCINSGFTGIWLYTITGKRDL
jgi:hypothetical protein